MYSYLQEQNTQDEPYYRGGLIVNWDIELAKLMKEEGKASVKAISNGAIVGLVVSKVPPKISILDGQAMLGKEHLYLANGADTFNFEAGQEVLLIATQDSQTYFLINKAVKL